MVQEFSDFSRVRLVKVRGGQEGQRLDNFLLGQLSGAPRSLIYRIIRKGEVRINGGRARPFTRLEPGDEVRIPPVRLQKPGIKHIPGKAREAVEAAIIAEHAHWLVVDKPAGMAVHAGSGVEWGVIDVIRELNGKSDAELVHRLDRETSGCLLIAKDKGAMRALQRQFREGTVDKRYLCLLSGRMKEEKIFVDQPLQKAERGGERFMQVDPRGKPAQTEFRLLEIFDDCSFTEVHLLTGRTHQIRVHAAFLGMPLAGDQRYGDSAQNEHWRSRGLNRLFLHASALTIQDTEGQPQTFSSPLPAPLKELLDQSQMDSG